MKSILVALDDTPAALAARDVALALAARHHARVTGAGIVDVDYLTAPEAVPMGGAYYKFKGDLEHLKRGHDRAQKLIDDFDKECKRHDIDGQAVALVGDPLPEILRAADAHDLIVLGRDTSFHAEPADGIAAPVARLLKENPRPMLITPPTAHAISPVLVAYDGSAPAARALQLFTLLQIGKGVPVHVLSVDADAAAAKSMARRAASYLDLYRVKAKVHGIASDAAPADIVLAEAKSLEVGILVMGAFGHGGLVKSVLGTCTRKVMAECPTGLFVHH